MLKFWGSKQFPGREIHLSLCLFFKERKLPNRCKISWIQNRIPTSDYVTFDFDVTYLQNTSPNLLLCNFGRLRFMIWHRCFFIYSVCKVSIVILVQLSVCYCLRIFLRIFSLLLSGWHWPLSYELGSPKWPHFPKEYSLHLIKCVVILATENRDRKEVLF